MVAEICCAYNVTRGCKLSSKVTAADSEREPLKVLKILIEGLARDSESGLWLTPLLHAPQLARLFPFDFVYLDGNHRVIEGAALLPGVLIPQFTDQTSSALVLPLESLARTETRPGDQIIVCAEEELELLLAEIPPTPVGEPVAPTAETPIAAMRIPFSAVPKYPLHPFPSPQVSISAIAASVSRGTDFTVGMTTSWQISNSTMATAAVLEPGETQEALEAEETTSEVAEIAVGETESTEAQEEASTTDSISIAEPVSDAAETVTGSSISEQVVDPILVPVVDQVLAPISDEAASTEVAESTREELVPALTQPAVTEPETTAAVPETLEPEAAEKELDSVGEAEGQEPKIDIFDGSSEAVPIVESARVQPDTNENAPQPKKLAEKAHAIADTSIISDPATTKRKSREEQKKGSLGGLVKRFLNCEDPLPERRSIIRLLAQGLVAYTGDGESTNQHEVRDVSPTGLCLRTEEEWQPGDIVSLVLKRKDAAEKDFERRVRVDARIVRCDEGEIGLSWLWPEGVEFDPWKRVHTKRSDETDADYFLRELRLARTLGFLRQICPDSADEIKLGFHQRLSNKRVASAVEIVLQGQEMLKQRGGTDMHADPEMVRRIVENGSWTEDNWIRRWWAGLLVSSCSAETPDTSNGMLVDLLAKLMPAHLRLLSFVCGKATELIEAGATAATLDMYCTPQELIEAVGSHSLARIQQTMGQLSVLGLLAESNKPSYVAVTDKVKTKTIPTSLGLTMYARCHGRQ
jgi:hypothetical protein